MHTVKELKGAVMNKLFPAAIILFLCIVMVSGCAKKTAEPAAEVTPPSQAAPAAPSQDMKMGDTAPSQAAPSPAATAAASFDKKIYFDFDRFDLSPESIETLNSLAAFLKANASLTVKIEGNCDERGTNEYNLALGERRAKAALDYLATQGIDTARLSTVSYGEEKPVDPGQNEEAWAKNRRDEFVLGN